MSISLLFKKKDFTIGSIKLDVLFSERHNRNASVTDNPVEDGSVFSDHIRNEPITVSLEGYVTNTPVSLFGAIGALISGANRTQDAFDALESLYKKREPFSIVTNLKVYSNMAIESLTISKQADSGGTFTLSLDAKQILKVNKETVSIPPSKVGGDPRTASQAKSAANLGKKPPTGATESTAVKSKSLLKSLYDGVSGNTAAPKGGLPPGI